MKNCRDAPHGTCTAVVHPEERDVPMELADPETVTCPACDAFERLHGCAPLDVRMLLHRAIRIIERNDVTPDERASVARELRRVRGTLHR